MKSITSNDPPERKYDMNNCLSYKNPILAAAMVQQDTSARPKTQEKSQRQGI